MFFLLLDREYFSEWFSGDPVNRPDLFSMPEKPARPAARLDQPSPLGLGRPAEIGPSIPARPNLDQVIFHGTLTHCRSPPLAA
jgi:hypothetical protein